MDQVLTSEEMWVLLVLKSDQGWGKKFPGMGELRILIDCPDPSITWIRDMGFIDC